MLTKISSKLTNNSSNLTNKSSVRHFGVLNCSSSTSFDIVGYPSQRPPRSEGRDALSVCRPSFTAVSVHGGPCNFRRLVLSSINADFGDKIRIAQHFSRSARCRLLHRSKLKILKRRKKKTYAIFRNVLMISKFTTNNSE